MIPSSPQGQASRQIAIQPPKIPEHPRCQNKDMTNCFSAGCAICGERESERENLQRRQFCLDHMYRDSMRPWECESCMYYFRQGGWADSRPHWVLHDTFLDLESSAIMGCRSCRLFRQAIVYDIPSSADLWALRFQRRPVWVLVDSEPPRCLKIEYGRYPKFRTLELTKDNPTIIQPESDIRVIPDTAYRMLQTCDSSPSHTTCMTANALHSLPTRVIDVGDYETLPFLYLSEGHSARYCTLSYTWGVGGGWFNTTTDNIAERLHSLPFELNGKSMPKTYHDAIIVVRSMGVRYLWIDALCIIQNDPGDWLRESEKMMGIYQNSYCTIAATGSTSAEEGFLNLRAAQQLSTSEAAFGSERPEIRYFRRHLKEAEPERKYAVQDAPLSSRGWVLQEMMLSPRILHFTTHCLYFDCLSTTLGELDQVDDSQSTQDPFLSLRTALTDQKSSHPLASYGLWWNVLHEYTKKSLTKEDDRLPAISGIAKRINVSLNDRYLAGLWQNNLIQDIQWFIPPRRPDATVVMAERPKVFVAPSWSWASVIGPVLNGKEPMGKWSTNWDEEEWCPAVDIIHASVDLVDVHNVYGRIAFGILSIRGRLRAVYLPPQDTIRMNGLFHDTEGGAKKFLSNVIRFDIVEEYHEASQREDLWYLEVYRCTKGEPVPDFLHDQYDGDVGPDYLDPVCSHALVLKPTGTENQYRRVGFAKLTNKTYFDDCEAQLVNII